MDEIVIYAKKELSKATIKAIETQAGY